VTALLADTEIALEIVVVDRDGELVGRTPFAPAHGFFSPRKRR
jgi:hypothetical protein